MELFDANEWCERYRPKIKRVKLVRSGYVDLQIYPVHTPYGFMNDLLAGVKNDMH